MITPNKPQSMHHYESIMEFLRRMVSNLNYEPESLLDHLPSIDAVVEYFDLWHIYNTDFLSGVYECVEEGDDPKELAHFINKYPMVNQTWPEPPASVLPLLNQPWEEYVDARNPPVGGQ